MDGRRKTKEERRRRKDEKSSQKVIRNNRETHSLSAKNNQKRTEIVQIQTAYPGMLTLVSNQRKRRTLFCLSLPTGKYSNNQTRNDSHDRCGVEDNYGVIL